MPNNCLKSMRIGDRIFVLGSANMDFAFPLDRLPREGETIAGGWLADMKRWRREYLLMAHSKDRDRAATVGFRCVAD
jgi:hypothetical protein